MKKLEQQDYSKIQAIIPSDVPNNTVVESILCGKTSGDIWVDEIESSVCVFINTGVLFSFVFGLPSTSFLRQICNEIKKKPSRYLYVETPFLITYFEKKYTLVPMIQFFLPDLAVQNIKKKQIDTLGPYEIRLIAEYDFKKCNWYQLMEKIFGCEENYLNYAKGYCIYEGEKIISEAHSGYISDNKYEIATITLPEYQGKNLSYSVCHQLINDYENQRQYKPIWSCAKNNNASVATATKLGFKIDKHYSLIKLS